VNAARRPRTRNVRYAVVLAFLLGGLVLLTARSLYLQVVTSDYLQRQGNARHSRVIKDNSHRGMILDRTGSPLAVSVPVDSVWAHPATLLDERRQWPALARLLDMSPSELARLVERNAEREFMYLKRHVPPPVAERVTALKLSGVSLLREYRRYYPAGSVAGHVLGFTNVDDHGLEGIELAYDNWLRAVPGTKRVLRDLHGNTVEIAESIRLPVPGRDLVVSLDRRIQYLAYRELKAAVATHGAVAGSAVVLDVRTGEVLAMVNEPDFNPNNRAQLQSHVFRNRAVTDLFEPGSTLKPFTVATALDSGKFKPTTLIETGPGTMQLGGRTIRDIHNYGTISVARVLEKSSNVGAAKIALALDKQSLWDTLRRLGFGQPTGSQLPGEASGMLHPVSSLGTRDLASLAYGYGISATPLQVARAYAALANGGELLPVTLLKRDEPPSATQALTTAVARPLAHMLEAAVSEQGTGTAARVADYRVAGKTGTVRKLVAGGYSETDYLSWFAGFAPLNDPRLAMVVVIDTPRRGGYFGGEVAAPVFGRVMAGALRLLDVAPDAPRTPTTRMVAATAGAGY